MSEEKIILHAREFTQDARMTALAAHADILTKNLTGNELALAIKGDEAMFQAFSRDSAQVDAFAARVRAHCVSQ